MKNFDELLDRVLREDGRTEPRTGLAGRVMARVRGEARSGSVLRLRNRRLNWLLVPTAACLGIMAAIWYVPGGPPRHDRVEAPASSVHSPEIAGLRNGIERQHPPVDEGRSNSGGSGRALRDAHLSRDKAAAKMGHPDLEDAPKLETFPAVSQKGDIAGWWGGSDGKLAAIAREATPETVKAYQQLRSAQDRPIDIAAIEIEPLR